MKSFLFTCSLVAFVITAIPFTTSAQWTPVYHTDVIGFTDLDFIDYETGIITGKGFGDGIILKTINGSTFVPKYQAPGTDLHTLYFVNNQTGYAAGKDGIVVKTTNYGETWTKLNQNYQFEILDIIFSDVLTGWACGTYGIIKTSDGGDHWAISYQISGSGNLRCITFSNLGTLVSGGTNGIMIYSEDGGTSWNNAQSGTTSVINSIRWAADNTGYACTSAGEVLISTDEGKSWTLKNTIDSQPVLNNIFIQTQSVIFLSGSNGLILKSVDAGNNWEVMATGSTEGVSALAYTSNNIGYAITAGGTILKDKNDAGLVELPGSAFNVFPVPAGDHLQLTWNTGFLPSEYCIYNQSGHTVKKALLKPLKINGSLTINLAGLRHGFYFLKLSDDKEFAAIKFLKY